MQLLLPLEIDIEYTHDDFIVRDCNAKSYTAICQANWISHRMLLMGEAGSGKSHLARIWADNNSACYLNEKEPFAVNCNVVIDNMQDIKDEEFLFHLINHCYENGYKLLMLARSYPNFSLNDLQSRINATPYFTIETPDDNMLKIVLYKQFVDRQIMVDMALLNYVLLRITRSFQGVHQFVRDLDLYSLRIKKSITIHLVRKFLEEYEYS